MVGVAQLVEPRVVIPVVVGSSPIVHPITILTMKMCFKPKSQGILIKILCLLWFFIWPADLLLAAPSSKQSQLYHFRLLIQKTSFQFILKSKKPLKFETHHKKSPHQFILDIPQAQLTNSGKKNLLSSNLVQSFEFIQQKNGKLRILFNLAKSVTPSVQVESPGSSTSGEYQLIIDFAQSYAKKSPEIPAPKEFLATKRFSKSTSSSKKASAKTRTSKRARATPTDVAKKQSYSYNKRNREVMIVIDPGHGGKDPGAIGRSGHYEKTIVLAIAKRLARTINRQSGFRAKLTRQGDYYVGLRKRLSIARDAKADLFISIHADAFRNPASHGVSIYALSQRGATSEAARWLARRENISVTLGDEKLANKDHLLSSVLINLSQNHSIAESLKIGKSILAHFNSFAKLHYRHVEQAAFVVLKSPDIPSLLVETGFLSNRYEERRLASSWYQERIAHALMAGIKQHFMKNPPPGTLIAARRSKYLNF